MKKLWAASCTDPLLSFTATSSPGTCWVVPVIILHLEYQAVLEGQKRGFGPSSTSGIARSVRGSDVMAWAYTTLSLQAPKTSKSTLGAFLLLEPRVLFPSTANILRGASRVSLT
jgi:hypothetical protein